MDDDIIRTQPDILEKFVAAPMPIRDPIAGHAAHLSWLQDLAAQCLSASAAKKIKQELWPEMSAPSLECIRNLSWAAGVPLMHAPALLDLAIETQVRGHLVSVLAVCCVRGRLLMLSSWEAFFVT